MYLYFSYDFVYVYDGDNRFADEIARLTGSPDEKDGFPFTVMSTGRDIFIYFLSDDTETTSGFKIQFEAGKK